jgi:hypothetical protein
MPTIHPERTMSKGETMKQKANKGWALPILALSSLVLLLFATASWADTYNAQVKFDRDYYMPYYVYDSTDAQWEFDCAHIGVRDVDWTTEPTEVIVHISSDTDPTGMDFKLQDTDTAPASDADSWWTTYGGVDDVSTTTFPDTSGNVNYATVCLGEDGEDGDLTGLRFDDLTSTEGDATDGTWGELLVSNGDTIIVSYVDQVGANGQETTVTDQAVVSYWSGDITTQPANLKYTSTEPTSANIVVLVTDHDLNLNPVLAETITASEEDCLYSTKAVEISLMNDIKVQSDKAGCDFNFSDATARTLVETGKNTGVFRAYGYIWDGSDCTQPTNPNNFECDAEINDDIMFKYYDRNNANGAAGTDTTHVAFGETVTGRLSLDSPATYMIGDKMTITIDDADMNLNPNQADVWDWNAKDFEGTGNCVKVTRTGSRDGAKTTPKDMYVPLIETGTNTGMFTGKIKFQCDEATESETHGDFEWVGEGTDDTTKLEGARNVTYTITYYDAADANGCDDCNQPVEAASFLTEDGSIEFADNILSQDQDVLVWLYDDDLNTDPESIQATYDPGSLGTNNDGETDTGITAAQDENWDDDTEHRPLAAPNVDECDGDTSYVMVLVTTYDGYDYGDGTNDVKGTDYDTVVLYMRETGVDTGIFTGWFNVSGTDGDTFDAANGNENTDILYVDGLDPDENNPDHEVIYAFYVDSPASGSELKLRTDTAATTSHVSTLTYEPTTPWFSDTVTATLTDTDLDTDPESPNVLTGDENEYNDTGGVKLESQSTKEGPVYLYFRETGNNTGIFTSTFEVCSENGCSQNGNAGIPAKIEAAVRDEVTLTLHDTNPDKEYEQKFILPSHDGQLNTTPVSGSDVSPNGDTIEITVIDQDLNLTNDNDDSCEGNQPQSPAANCSVTCSSESNDLGVDVKLEETGTDTGVFTGYVQTCLTADCSQGGPPAKIEVAKGDLVTVTYEDEFNAAGQEGVISVAVFYAQYILGDMEWTEDEYEIGESAIIRLDERDLDTNPLSPQTVTVSAYSSTDQAGIQVTLLETGNMSHVFEKAIMISATSSVDNTSLKASDGDTLTARYEDLKNNNGMPETVYAYATVKGDECEYEHTGDVDENGSIDPDDALAALLIFLEEYDNTECSEVNADVCPDPDGDGVVDPGDAVAILKIYLGITPICD